MRHISTTYAGGYRIRKTRVKNGAFSRARSSTSLTKKWKSKLAWKRDLYTTGSYLKRLQNTFFLNEQSSTHNTILLCLQNRCAFTFSIVQFQRSLFRGKFHPMSKPPGFFGIQIKKSRSRVFDFFRFRLRNFSEKKIEIPESGIGIPEKSHPKATSAIFPVMIKGELEDVDPYRSSRTLTHFSIAKSQMRKIVKIDTKKFWPRRPEPKWARSYREFLQISKRWSKYKYSSYRSGLIVIIMSNLLQ